MTTEDIDLADLDADPIREFAHWFALAKESEDLANAMSLATVDSNGRPTSRMVLLKGHDDDGLEFYTSYSSAKARHIAQQSQVALLFYWKSLRRQVRFEGIASRVSRQASESYWATRPRGSQLAASASTQSAEVESRSGLEQAVDRLSDVYPDDVPLPEDWGGYRVVPDRVEFWVDRKDRLHDRFLYERQADNGWRQARLSP